MRLHEAIESGRPFNRAKRTDWIQPHTEGADRWRPHMANGEIVTFSYDDLVADDWFIKEPTVTITRTQLADAVLAYIHTEAGHRNFFAPLGGPYPDPVKFMCDKLGLSET